MTIGFLCGMAAGGALGFLACAVFTTGCREDDAAENRRLRQLLVEARIETGP